jgi:hypothetical protein
LQQDHQTIAIHAGDVSLRVQSWVFIYSLM